MRLDSISRRTDGFAIRPYIILGNNVRCPKGKAIVIRETFRFLYVKRITNAYIKPVRITYPNERGRESKFRRRNVVISS